MMSRGHALEHMKSSGTKYYMNGSIVCELCAGRLKINFNFFLIFYLYTFLVKWNDTIANPIQQAGSLLRVNNG